MMNPFLFPNKNEKQNCNSQTIGNHNLKMTEKNSRENSKSKSYFQKSKKEIRKDWNKWTYHPIEFFLNSNQSSTSIKEENHYKENQKQGAENVRDNFNDLGRKNVVSNKTYLDFGANEKEEYFCAKSVFNSLDFSKINKIKKEDLILKLANDRELMDVFNISFSNDFSEYIRNFSTKEKQCLSLNEFFSILFKYRLINPNQSLISTNRNRSKNIAQLNLKSLYPTKTNIETNIVKVSNCRTQRPCSSKLLKEKEIKMNSKREKEKNECIHVKDTRSPIIPLKTKLNIAKKSIIITNEKKELNNFEKYANKNKRSNHNGIEFQEGNKFKDKFNKSSTHTKLNEFQTKEHLLKTKCVEEKISRPFSFYADEMERWYLKKAQQDENERNQNITELNNKLNYERINNLRKNKEIKSLMEISKMPTNLKNDIEKVNMKKKEQYEKYQNQFKLICPFVPEKVKEVPNFNAIHQNLKKIFWLDKEQNQKNHNRPQTQRQQKKCFEDKNVNSFKKVDPLLNLNKNKNEIRLNVTLKDIRKTKKYEDEILKVD